MAATVEVHRLPRLLDDDDCWVPAGWTLIGGDELAPDAGPRQRVWVDGFVMRRFPVTAGEYVAFLASVEDPHRWVPLGPEGAPLYTWEGGRYQLPADVPPDTPVVRVDLHGARRYAAWIAGRDGVPWRLPTELEREKAARGADGRFWPWGDHFEPAWAHTVRSRSLPRLGPVGEFPADVSVYGVRGLAGGVRDWTATAYRATPPVEDGGRATVHDEVGEDQVVRGGAWSSSGGLCRPAARFGGAPGNRHWNTGFRLARSC
jgi:eukaryotic-like serine/threonine-protein kinase